MIKTKESTEPKEANEPKCNYFLYVGIFDELREVYVGISRQPKRTRWRQHRSGHGSKHIKRRLDEGFEIRWEAPLQGLTASEAVEAEKCWIERYRLDHITLNIAPSGALGSPEEGGFRLTEEEKLTRAAARQRVKHSRLSAEKKAALWARKKAYEANKASKLSPEEKEAKIAKQKSRYKNRGPEKKAADAAADKAYYDRLGDEGRAARVATTRAWLNRLSPEAKAEKAAKDKARMEARKAG